MGDIGADKTVKTDAAPAPPHPSPFTFDDLIRQRGVEDGDEPGPPLLAYPKTRLGIDDFELINGKLLNRFLDGAAKTLIRAGVEAVSGTENGVVGIYGTSDLDYIVTVFGLGRLGYTSFLLSPRLPVNAVVALLKGADASHIFHAPQFQDLAINAAQELSLKRLPILVRSEYDNDEDAATPPFERVGVDGPKEHLKKLIMMHSSGSTGLPRALDYTHRRLFTTLIHAQDLTAFQSTPVFHAHGLVTLLQAIAKRKVVYLFNGNVPQTHDSIKAAIKAANPEIVWTVPYALKLLAEKPGGIDVLKNCRIVSCSGSKCPDELGDLMVKEGIHFGTTFGATEVAMILNSLDRPREDKAWNYLRPPPHVAPYIKMKPIDGEICECVVLDGHKGKVVTNSNDPPNSFHTKDLFIAHPTIPNAWKFVGRLDDRVTLLNGEKVLPLPMEGRIQQDPLVKEAVIFGVDRSVPGLLLFRAKAAAQLTDEEYLTAVWPVIEDANSRAEGFSQISKEMVAIIPDHIDCPSTDKSSIKRAQVYREFASVIDDIYTRLETASGTLKLSVPELQDWVISSFKELGIRLQDAKTDFFAAGVDSLKAIQMRGLIIKNIDLGGHVDKCPSLVVFDTGNTEKLAKALYAIRAGESLGGGDEDSIQELSDLVEGYSRFSKRIADGTVPEPEIKVVIITGATGSLGSHVLAQLVSQPNVSKVYCLIRTSNSESALDRLTSALQERRLAHLLNSPKVHPLAADLSAADFALTSATLETLRSETTHIIHCAWAVNFALPISSFVPQLASVQNLLSLSLSSPHAQPAHFLFCSSVGAAMAAPTNTIPEAPLADLSYASHTGYARSKLVSERIVEAAVAKYGARATILRIGQIIPSLESGSLLWNPNEAIPLLVRSALSIGHLPGTTSSNGADSCSWIDVDTLAKTIVDIGEVSSPNSDEIKEAQAAQLVFNLVHPRPFSWSQDFLPALKTAGLEFEVQPYAEWLELLEKSPDDTKNTSKKLVGFWQEQAQAGQKRKGELRFETGKAERKSQALREAKPVTEGPLVKAIVDAWRAVW